MGAGIVEAELISRDPLPSFYFRQYGLFVFREELASAQFL